MDDGKVTITIEVDAELLAQVTEVLKPYGLTPEDAVVQFIEYCVAPETQDHAIKLLKRWKKEQERWAESWSLNYRRCLNWNALNRICSQNSWTRS